MDELISPTIDIEDLKNNLFKYFVKFYGEKHSEYIRYKLDNCLEVILYNSIDSIAQDVRSKTVRKKLELTIDFLRKNGIEISSDLEDEIIMDKSSSLLDSIPHAKDLLNLYFESGSYGDSNFCGFRLCFMNSEVNNNTWLNTNRQRFLKKLGAEISADEDIEKFLQSEAGQPYNALIEKQRQIIGHLDMKYQQFSKQHEVLYEEIDRYDKLKNQINAKYSIKFLSSIANLLTDRDLNKINEYGAKRDYEGFIRFFYDFDCYHTIFKSLQYGSLIEAFSSEKSLALESVETSRFMKNTIINDRLEYFKRMGLNDDNKTYEELTKCLDVNDVPDAKMVDSLIECRLKYQEMANDEYFRLSSDYASIEKKFNDMDLVYDSDITIADLSSGCQYTSPNVRKDNLDVVGVVYYSPLKTLEGYADVQFIHEINHVIDLI